MLLWVSREDRNKLRNRRLTVSCLIRSVESIHIESDIDTRAECFEVESASKRPRSMNQCNGTSSTVMIVGNDWSWSCLAEND